MTTAPSQTLASGKTVASKYGKLGYTGVTMIPPVDHLLGLLVSFPARGKSYLLQSNPSCYIYNVDGSSTVFTDCPATIWPGVGEHGEPTDPTEGPIKLTFERMLDKLKVLEQMAEDGYADRPRCVAVDSLGLLIPLVKEWVVRNAVPLRISRDPVDSWNDLHGPAAWDECYNAIGNFALAHRRAGYGFWFTLHLTMKVLSLSDGTSERMVGVNITDNFWSRLFPLFEIIAVVEKESGIRNEKTTRTLPDGRKVPGAPKEIPYVQHYLTVDATTAPAARNILKPRRPIPGKVILDAKAPWASFADAYTASVDS